ncbi:zinc finger protein 501-like [Pollicipes pollicipes]|uniref:zinc finger protein 501-like n=1 Tax=Pollicipes pollicipes TaxID=41117 RepID=UPI0018850822|nr:zinc finger protein 501-like [Pollicipes pollicipes]
MRRRPSTPAATAARLFRLRAGLEAHRRLAHGDGPTERCAICQRQFTSSRRLQRHLVTHNVRPDASSASDTKTKESAEFECPTCKKTFTTAHFLKKHSKLHTGETPYVCDVCGRGFALQQSHHKHQQYHTGQRPYACPQCGRAFRESATLQNHMRIHSGEKPWTCETCGKSFRQRITYVVHRRIHTGALPYTCTGCNSGFRYKVSLRAHKCTATEPTSAPTLAPPEGSPAPDNLQTSPAAAPSSTHPRQHVAAGSTPALTNEYAAQQSMPAAVLLEPSVFPFVAEEFPLEDGLATDTVSVHSSGPLPAAVGTPTRLAAAGVPEGPSGQQRFRPKVSRVLLHRLVQKLRAIESVARELANIPLNSPPPPTPCDLDMLLSQLFDED